MRNDTFKLELGVDNVSLIRKTTTYQGNLKYSVSLLTRITEHIKLEK